MCCAQTLSCSRGESKAALRGNCIAVLRSADSCVSNGDTRTQTKPWFLRAPHGTIADSPVSGRQLYMDEGSVTSEAGQTSTSSSEEGSEQESSEVGELKKRLLGAALKHVVSLSNSFPSSIFAAADCRTCHC